MPQLGEGPSRLALYSPTSLASRCHRGGCAHRGPIGASRCCRAAHARGARRGEEQKWHLAPRRLASMERQPCGPGAGLLHRHVVRMPTHTRHLCPHSQYPPSLHAVTVTPTLLLRKQAQRVGVTCHTIQWRSQEPSNASQQDSEASVLECRVNHVPQVLLSTCKVTPAWAL